MKRPKTRKIGFIMIKTYAKNELILTALYNWYYLFLQEYSNTSKGTLFGSITKLLKSPFQ